MELRDGLFVLAWFGLMAFVWLGWAQEAPPKGSRAWLGVGQGLGLAAAAGGAVLVAHVWDTPSVLEGRYHWFGLVVLVEVLAAVAAVLVLRGRGQQRWYAFGVAVVVAAHFVPLAWLLEDWSLAVLGVAQIVLLVVARRLVERRALAPSFVSGVAMGATLLLSALVTGALWLPEAVAGW